MFTVQLKNRQFGYVSHYGRFANLTDAQAAATNMWRSGLNATFTAVPTPDGVTPKPLHVSYAPAGVGN